MNYLREINAFRLYLKTNPIPATAQALWYVLMDFHNSCGWERWITIDNLRLQAELMISKPTLNQHRLHLIQAGLLDYQSQQKKKNSGKYRLLSFECEEVKTRKETGKIILPESLPVLLPESLPVPCPDPLHKDLKPKPKVNQNKNIVTNVTGSPAKELLDEYFQLFKAKFGEKPVISGAKDMELLKKLLAVHSKERLSQLLIDFFASDDPFITNGGYTIGVFFVKINKLLVARVKVEKNPTLFDPVECKCDGRGWYVIFDEMANNGNGANKVIVCPCKKKG